MLLNMGLFNFKKTPEKGIKKLNKKHGGKILNGLFFGSLVDQMLYLPGVDGVDITQSQSGLWSSHDHQRCEGKDYTHELTDRELYTVDIPGLQDREINDLTPKNIIDSNNTEIMQTLRSTTMEELKNQGLVSIQNYKEISQILKWDIDVSEHIHETQHKVFMVTPKGNGLIFPLSKRKNDTPVLSGSSSNLPLISGTKPQGI